MPYHGSGSRREERKTKSRERNSSRSDRNREGGEKRHVRDRDEGGRGDGKGGRGDGEAGRGARAGGHDTRELGKGGRKDDRGRRGGRGYNQGGDNNGRSYNDPYMMHDDSGMGMMHHSPYGNPFFDGFNMGGGGAWGGRMPFNRPFMPSPVFGRGQARGRMPFISTPDFGRGGVTPYKARGGGRGGYNRGDAEGSGTATAILARRVQELEVENESLKTQLKETPKKKTLEELDNIKEKSSSLKNKVQTLEENLASKELELFKLVGIKDAIEGFTMGGGSESKTEECILDSCSDRVKKHMKIIISNKLDQDDLKSCLRIIFLRLDGHYSCEEIIRFFAGLDNPMAAVENLAKALKGVGDCQEDTAEGEDSAPSSESEGEISGEEKKLQPKKLEYKEGKCKSQGTTLANKILLDTAKKNKMGKSREAAKELRKAKIKEKIKEVAEDVANKDMETGDASMIACYDDLVDDLYKLTNAPAGKGQEASPIIKKRRGGAKQANDSKKAKKAKIETLKTYSDGGVTIRSYQAGLFSMKQMIEDAESDGAEILDKNTGKLIKRMPCGFYPTCLNSLGKDSMVIGGKLILPKERRKDDKSLYICKEHTADVEDKWSKAFDEEDGLGEMDELETSVMEEEMASMNTPDREGTEGEDDDDDEEAETRNEEDADNLFSQSLLKK